MLSRRSAAASTVTLAAVLALTAVPLSASAAEEPTSLADVLAADGRAFDDHSSDFDILDAAVSAVLEAKPDSPLAVLADGDQPLTAFLPEDNGFTALAYDIQGATGEYPDSEQEAFDTIATLGVDTIESVLLFHVVPGDTLEYGDLAALRQGAPVITALDGQKLTITVWNRDPAKGRIGAVVVNDGSDYYGQLLNQRDINVGNPQIAHSIVLDTLKPREG